MAVSQPSVAGSLRGQDLNLRPSVYEERPSTLCATLTGRWTHRPRPMPMILDLRERIEFLLGKPCHLGLESGRRMERSGRQERACFRRT